MQVFYNLLMDTIYAFKDESFHGGITSLVAFLMCQVKSQKSLGIKSFTSNLFERQVKQQSIQFYP